MTHFYQYHKHRSVVPVNLTAVGDAKYAACHAIETFIINLLVA